MPFSLDLQRSRLWLWITLGIIILQSSTGRLSGPDIEGSDKFAHFLFYGLIATHLQLSGYTGGRTWLSFVLVVLFGVTDEFHQSFVPGRDASLFDLLSDAGGAALALLMLSKVPLYRRVLSLRIC